MAGEADWFRLGCYGVFRGGGRLVELDVRWRRRWGQLWRGGGVVAVRRGLLMRLVTDSRGMVLVKFGYGGM